MRITTAFALTATLALAGCKKEPQKPVAGVMAAGAPLLMQTKAGPRPLAVGATLKAGDHVEATGPAVLEFFGGAVRFLEDGDDFVVGDLPEVKMLGDTVPARMLSGGKLTPRPAAQRIIPARYHQVTFTPKTQATKELTQGDYFRAFFTPDGISKLKEKVPTGEGPRNALPPPPFRKKVPHVHAGDLGEGGLRLEVEDGYAVAEAKDMATAVLTEGDEYDLGRATRLLLPDGAEAVLTGAGEPLRLEGPLDISLR